MTSAQKKQIWEALYKCTRNGYPGATYQQYDSPKDPRVRGGRYPWTQQQLRELYEMLVVYGEANQTVAAWRELQKYKTKIAPACLRSIFQSITFLPTISYAIVPDSLSITEGQIITFNILTSGIPDGTVLYWTLYSTSPDPITAADFSDGLGNGSVTIVGNFASFTRELVDDFVYEPPEYFNIELRTGSIAGPVVAMTLEIEVVNNPEPLRLVFQDLTLIPFDYTEVANWNTFFDLPGAGGPATFTSVEVIGTEEVRLRGIGFPGLLTFKTGLFQNDGNLVSVYDYGGFVGFIGKNALSFTGFLGIAYFPQATSIGLYAFNYAAFKEIYLPLFSIAPPSDGITNTTAVIYDLSGFIGDYLPYVNNNTGAPTDVTLYLNDSIMTGNSGNPFVKTLIVAVNPNPLNVLMYTSLNHFYTGLVDSSTSDSPTSNIIISSLSYDIVAFRTGTPIPDLTSPFEIEYNPLTGSWTATNFGGSFTYSYPNASSRLVFTNFSFSNAGLVGGETFNIIYRDPTNTIIRATSPTYTYVGLGSVTNGTAGSITFSTAAITNSNATGAGGGTISARGIVYSASNPTPTIGGAGVTNSPSGSGLGLFNNSLSGLAQNTRYNWRAYVTNEAGTGYASPVLSFTTSPVPISANVTSITSSSAQMNGNAITGNGTITGRGVCYSSVNNPPTIADSTVTAGTGTGTYNATMSGLTSSTLYYARAYATNATGTGYGATRTFTTLAPVPASQGPNGGSAAVSDSSNGGTQIWTNPTNVFTDNGIGATAYAPYGPLVTEYLKVTGFGFSIPAGATIKGITVQVKKANVTANVVDSEIKLIKAGIVGGTNKADTISFWPYITTPGTVTYGGATDLWGQSWTATDINASNFGIVVSANILNIGGKGVSGAWIDYISIKVDYTT